MLGSVKERGRGALPDFQCVERFITYEAKEGVVIVDIVNASRVLGSLGLVQVGRQKQGAVRPKESAQVEDAGVKPRRGPVPLIHELIARFLEDIAVVTGGVGSTATMQ